MLFQSRDSKRSDRMNKLSAVTCVLLWEAMRGPRRYNTIPDVLPLEVAQPAQSESTQVSLSKVICFVCGMNFGRSVLYDPQSEESSLEKDLSIHCELKTCPNSTWPKKLSYNPTLQFMVLGREKFLRIHQLRKWVCSGSSSAPSCQHVRLIKHLVSVGSVGSRHWHSNGIFTSGDATPKKTDRSTWFRKTFIPQTQLLLKLGEQEFRGSLVTQNQQVVT